MYRLVTDLFNNLFTLATTINTQEILGLENICADIHNTIRKIEDAEEQDI